MTGTAVHYAVNREGHYKEIPKQARNETCPLSQQRHVRAHACVRVHAHVQGMERDVRGGTVGK